MAITLGGRYPLHAGAAGKLLLAYLSDSEQKDVLPRLKLSRYTYNTITSIEDLKIVAKIRTHGYSVSISEHIDSGCAIAAPIKNNLGEVIAALSVSGLAKYFTAKNKESPTSHHCRSRANFPRPGISLQH